MAEKSTSEAYFGADNNRLDIHWVTRRAYPPSDRSKPRSISRVDFHVDATAVYNSGRGYGVMVHDPVEGVPDHFDVTIPPQQTLDLDKRYEDLVLSIEQQLGRTGLKIFIY